MTSSIYDLFRSCTDYTLDKYWVSLFKECSRGRFPRNFRLLDDRTISVVNVKKQRINYDIPDSTEEGFFLFISKIFREDLCLESDLDKKCKWQIYEETQNKQDTASIDNWKKVRSKNKRIEMMSDYVLVLKKEHDLDTKFAITGVRKLLFLFNMGYITNEDIVLQDQKIDHIKGVSVEEGKICCEKRELSFNSERGSGTTKKYFTECEKFINSCNKNLLYL